MTTQNNNHHKSDIQATDQVTLTLKEGFVWTTQHTKLLYSAIAIFITVGAVTSFYTFWTERKELKAQEAYFSVDSKLSEIKKKNPTDTKESAVLAPEFEAVFKGHSGTKASIMALIKAGELYSKDGQYDKALEVLNQNTSTDGLIPALALQMKGTILADKGDCQGAVQAWEKITTNKSLIYLHGEIKLRMALCYEAMNDLSKAENLYTELTQKSESKSQDFGPSKEAAKYLRLLKSKKAFSQGT